MRIPLPCLCLVALLGFGTGCSRDPDADWRVPREALLLEACPPAVALTNGVTRPFADLASNAVLVAVNGRVLTKGTFETLMALYLKGILDQKKTSPLVADKMLEEHRRAYPRIFVGQRLLVDEAFRSGLVTTNEVLEAVSARIRAVAKQKKLPIARLLGGYAHGAHYFLYEQCVSYIIDKAIHEKIPPKTTVDEAFVEAVKKQVQVENAASRATNAVARAALEKACEQFRSGRQTWTAVAAELEACGLGEGGDWGTFTADDFDNATHAAKVFALKEGELSEILEDDNGYRVVRVDKILPEEKDADGNELNPERRHLSHLHVDKRPLLIEDSDLVLTRDLKRQMQTQAVNEFVTGLATNGQNKVVYPNGVISP